MILLENEYVVSWIPWLESNTVFFESLFSIVTIFLGGVTIYIGINHIKNKQFEASFGFYINLLAYINRYNFFIDNYPKITELLFSPQIRKKVFLTEMSKERADAVAPLFSELCNEFLNFISNATNNVPPVERKNKEEWKLWYNNILTITNFLQKCALIGSNLSPYFDEKQVEEYRCELENVKKAVEKIKSQISVKIGYEEIIKISENQ